MVESAPPQSLYLKRSPLVPLGALLVLLALTNAYPDSWRILPGWFGRMPMGDDYFLDSYATSGAIGVLLVGLAGRYAAELSWWGQPTVRRRAALVAWVGGLAFAVASNAYVISRYREYFTPTLHEQWYFYGIPSALCVGAFFGLWGRRNLALSTASLSLYAVCTALVFPIFARGVDAPSIALSVPLVWGAGPNALQVTIPLIFAACFWLFQRANPGPGVSLLLAGVGVAGLILVGVWRGRTLAAGSLPEAFSPVELSALGFAGVLVAALFHLRALFAERSGISLIPTLPEHK